LFEDEITGITMKAIKIKNVALVLSSTYELLDNKTFHVKDTSDSAEDQLAVFNGEYSKVVDKRVSSTNGDDSGLISDGLWRSNIITLTIMDEQFRYSIKDKVYAETWYESGKPWYFIDIKILQGTWSQDGNLITLHDEHTGHDFYLIYEYPNLRTMLLPGDWSLDGTVLTPR
jgi:hypothetical protein